MAQGVPAAGAERASKSFKDVVANGSSVPGRVDVSYGEVHGFPAVFISDEDMRSLAKPFDLTLIGKFVLNRPPVEAIRKFISRLKFLGVVRVDPFDKLNVIFRFSDDRDYARFFARRFYKVFGVDMKVTKWSPFINVAEDLPIIPLWISFPGLRYHLFHKNTLMDIAKVFGKPLCIDSSTASQGNMSKARVLVEIDVSVTHPEKVWIGSLEQGAFQHVVIENKPNFCNSCRMYGHLESVCSQVPSVPFVGLGGECIPPPSDPVAPLVTPAASPCDLLVESPPSGPAARELEGTPLVGMCNPPPELPDCTVLPEGVIILEEGEIDLAISDSLKDDTTPVCGFVDHPKFGMPVLTNLHTGTNSTCGDVLFQVNNEEGVFVSVADRIVSAPPSPPSELVGVVQGVEETCLQMGECCDIPAVLVSGIPSVVEILEEPPFPPLSYAAAAVDGGGKILFSNILKHGTLASPPSRKTRAMSKGSGDAPLAGLSLSRKGKKKELSGANATVLDAILNPPDYNV